jgi:heme-degrading monooxygenase HmoA
VHARMHTLELTAEQYDRGLKLIIDDLLPWVRDAGGFRGLVGLVDRERGKAVVLTFWADEASFEKSAEAGERLSVLAAAASGATRRELESYEVSIFELP